MPVPAQSERSGLFAAVALLFLLSLAAAAGPMWNRHTAERAANGLILAVDGEEVAQVAARSGVPAHELLERLRSAGVTAVGVHEYTLQDAVDDGRAFLLTGGALSLFPDLTPATPASAEGRGAVIAGGLPPARGTNGAEAGPRFFGIDLDAAEPWLAEAVERSLPGVARYDARDGRIRLWALPQEHSPQAISIGFDPAELEAVAKAGLDIVVRLRSNGRPWEAQRRAVEQIPAGAAAAVVFWGAQVAGFPGYIDEAAGALRLLGAPVGVIEFAEQRGLKELANALDYRAVRVHSITGEEMAAGIPLEVALRRWERAARERGVRLAYVRFYPGSTAEEAAVYAGAVAGRLAASGFVLGRPVDPPGPRGTSTLWTLLFGAALTGGAGGWLAGQLLRAAPLRAAGRGAPAAAALAACAIFALVWLKGYTILARQLLAGLSAVVFPALAVVVGLEIARSCGGDAAGSAGRRARGVAAAAVRGAAPGFAASAAVTLSGAMLVALFMDDVRFFLKLEEFRGVKAAYVAPLVFVAASEWLVWRRSCAGPRAGGRPRSFKALLTARIQVWHVLLGAAAAGALLVYLLRSGNQGLPVFGLEASLRALFEDILVARPRFKEFVVGHPALLCSLALAASSAPDLRSRHLLASGLAVAGAVGPVSILNTFAHAHSPLALSFLRTAYGLGLGLVFGAAAAAIFAAVRGSVNRTGRPRARRRSAPGAGA